MLRWLLLAFPSSVLAHPGHGATEIHLHPSEWAWLVLALAVAGAIAWWMRK